MSAMQEGVFDEATSCSCSCLQDMECMLSGFARHGKQHRPRSMSVHVCEKKVERGSQSTILHAGASPHRAHLLVPVWLAWQRRSETVYMFWVATQMQPLGLPGAAPIDHNSASGLAGSCHARTCRIWAPDRSACT